MEWSRVKNILIVLLVIVNVFLFLVYLGTTVNEAKNDDELVSHTVNVLAKNGVTINKNLIPRNHPVLYPATSSVNFRIAEKILGRVTVEGERYFSEKGEIIFDGAYFEGEFTTDKKAGAQSAKKLLEDIAQNADIDIDAIEVTERDGVYIATARQMITKMPVSNGKIRLSIDSEGRAEICGTAISNDTSAVRSREPYDICGLLVGATDKMTPGEITGIKLCFHYSLTGANQVYLLPVWQVTIDGSDFYINAMNGETVDF